MDEQNKYWGKLSDKLQKPEEIKNKRTYSSQHDIDFLKEYLKKDFTLLDLGSGTGEIINYVYEDLSLVVAVELFPKFSKFIVQSPIVKIVNEDIRTYETHEKFDVVTAHGVLQCFNKKDAYQIYDSVYKYLKKGGFFIQRIHCGKNEDLTFNGFSKELQADYFANFRFIDNEIAYLKDLGFESVEKFDLHGPELNKWENSHHYTIVCKK